MGVYGLHVCYTQQYLLNKATKGVQKANIHICKYTHIYMETYIYTHKCIHKHKDTIKQNNKMLNTKQHYCILQHIVHKCPLGVIVKYNLIGEPYKNMGTPPLWHLRAVFTNDPLYVRSRHYRRVRQESWRLFVMKWQTDYPLSVSSSGDYSKTCL